MTTAFSPTPNELADTCDTLVPLLHTRVCRPWCDESFAQSHVRLFHIALRNFYGGRWQRLCSARRSRWAPHAWPQYVHHVATCIEANFDLVAALQCNDSTAWQTIHAHMHDLLRRHLATSGFGYLRRQWDSDDITQTACEKLIRVLPRYPWDVSFMAWLNSVACHQMADQVYKGRRLHDATVVWEIETTDDVWANTPCPPSARRLALDDHSHLLLRYEAWGEALAALPTEAQRVVFYRRRLCGWDLNSVAVLIERSYTATASILLRADRNIRTFVEMHPDHFRD